MNILSIENRPRWNPENFYVDIKIDGLFIEQWLSQFNTKNLYDIKISSLIRAFSLRDDLETETVWLYLGQLAEQDKYFVPILTCSDDVDLSCFVIVTEQFIQNKQIHWLRFGLLKGEFLEQNADEIEWFADIPPLTFEQQNFVETFSLLLQDIKDEYLKYGKVLNIKFPADPPKPPKEDWEFIVDSWYN